MMKNFFLVVALSKAVFFGARFGLAGNGFTDPLYLS